MATRKSALLLILPLLLNSTVDAQYYQTDFPAEEFRDRHAKVFEQIGADAVAVIQGMPQTEASRSRASTTPFTTCQG